MCFSHVACTIKYSVTTNGCEFNPSCHIFFHVLSLKKAFYPTSILLRFRQKNDLFFSMIRIFSSDHIIEHLLQRHFRWWSDIFFVFDLIGLKKRNEHMTLSTHLLHMLEQPTCDNGWLLMWKNRAEEWEPFQTKDPVPHHNNVGICSFGGWAVSPQGELFL